ncbi:MAG TPA: transcription termination factor Rho [Deltaproteobacteria bacterium]|nr:transcription termination factor Rho [Deltaproteobacteria bacterium]
MPEKKAHKEEKPLERMTVKELREIALEIPHEHTEIAVRDMNKEQLVSFIKKARGIADEGPSHPQKKAKAKVVLTKQDVKTKIRSLKKDRDAALEQKDARALSILRRRINRLKKLSRKIA